MTKGFFITFEGGEGVGKTTQITLLENFLKDKGYDVVITREPGGTKAAEEIRHLLSHKEHGGKWTPEAELMLLFAARAQHINDVIRPALGKGQIILCDRYIDSTRVYQGYLQHIPMDFIKVLEQRIAADAMPNLTLLFDLEENIAMKRVKSRGGGDHYDQGDYNFYKTLRDGFIDLANKNKDRIKIINANQKIETIAKDIEKIVLGKLPNAI